MYTNAIKFNEQKVREMRADGKTWREIAVFYGCHRKTIQRYGKKLNLTKKSRSCPAQDAINHEKFKKLYGEGVEYSEMCRLLNSNESTLRNLRDSLRLPKRQDGITDEIKEYVEEIESDVTNKQGRDMVLEEFGHDLGKAGINGLRTIPVPDDVIALRARNGQLPKGIEAEDRSIEELILDKEIKPILSALMGTGIGDSDCSKPKGGKEGNMSHFNLTHAEDEKDLVYFAREKLILPIFHFCNEPCFQERERPNQDAWRLTTYKSKTWTLLREELYEPVRYPSGEIEFKKVRFYSDFFLKNMDPYYLLLTWILDDGYFKSYKSGKGGQTLITCFRHFDSEKKRIAKALNEYHGIPIKTYGDGKATEDRLATEILVDEKWQPNPCKIHGFKFDPTWEKEVLVPKLLEIAKELEVPQHLVDKKLGQTKVIKRRNAEIEKFENLIVIMKSPDGEEFEVKEKNFPEWCEARGLTRYNRADLKRRKNKTSKGWSVVNIGEFSKRKIIGRGNN
jgi:hypothetical protein